MAFLDCEAFHIIGMPQIPIMLKTYQHLCDVDDLMGNDCSKFLQAFNNVLNSGRWHLIYDIIFWVIQEGDLMKLRECVYAMYGPKSDQWPCHEVLLKYTWDCGQIDLFIFCLYSFMYHRSERNMRMKLMINRAMWPQKLESIFRIYPHTNQYVRIENYLGKRSYKSIKKEILKMFQSFKV